MEKTIENYAYDIVLNNFNELGLYLYKVVDKEIFSEHGRRDYYREYIYMGYEFPKDIQVRIQDLQKNGFFHMNQFKNFGIDVYVSNPLMGLKLFLLSKNNKLLEKVYGDKVVQNMSYLVSYITCVNMKSGEVSFLEIANHGIYSEDKIINLEYLGYKHINQSFGYQYTKDKDEQMKKR